MSRVLIIIPLAHNILDQMIWRMKIIDNEKKAILHGSLARSDSLQESLGASEPCNLLSMSYGQSVCEYMILVT